MQEQEFEWGAASTTGREQVFLAIRPNGLATLTGHLVFRVTVTTSQGELTFSEWSAQLPSRPTKGHCSVLPSRGRSLSTLFTVACNGFSTVMPPLTYCITAGQGDDAVLLNCGREAVVTSITLPPGDAVANNNLDLTVKATDSLGGSIFHKLSVIVEKQTIDTMLEDGSSSLDDLEVLARTENLPALTRLVQAIVPALTDTPPSPAEPPSSEGKIKDMKRTKHIEVRKRMISALASVPVQTVEAVQQVSQAMSTVTAVPEEVTVSMQLSTTQALLGLSDSLLKLSANASGRAGPGKEDVARFLVMATGHVLEALRASTLMGEEEENDRETKSGIEERQKVTAGVLGTVDRLQNVLLSDRVPGEEVISVSTPALALALDRCKPGTLANYQIQGTEETSGSFSLPKSLPIPDGDDNAIDVEMVSFANNPYSWSENGSEVTGMVSSLTLKSSKDRGVLPVDNLSESIEIMLPRSGKSASAITWTEISADGNLTVIAVNITRDDTALVVVVEARSRAVLPAMFLFLRVDEWPTETEYNLTASLGHYTGHTWVINAEELPGLGTYYLAIKVAAEEAEGPEIWTTPGTLQERNGSLFLATFSARCLFWMDEEQTWSGSGCKVGPRTTPLVTQCLCYQLDIIRCRLPCATQHSGC
uniref:REJ domain-containing protein n=1 Tax=Eptatretus burgeri TaxID=7764 RepID=A0A8C4NHZ7_EPTBU